VGPRSGTLRPPPPRFTGPPSTVHDSAQYRESAYGRHHLEPKRTHIYVTKGRDIRLRESGKLKVLDERYPQLTEWHTDNFGKLVDMAYYLIDQKADSALHKELMDDGLHSGQVVHVRVK
jgi:hypothetical protein